LISAQAKNDAAGVPVVGAPSFVGGVSGMVELSAGGKKPASTANANYRIG
jgi:hypothetical protein